MVEIQLSKADNKIAYLAFLEYFTYPFYFEI